MRISSHVLRLKMAGRSNVVSSFSPRGAYLAFSGYDGVLKILETVTGNSIADFSPSKHLTATCTCLQWGPGRHLKSVSFETLLKPCLTQVVLVAIRFFLCTISLWFIALLLSIDLYLAFFVCMKDERGPGFVTLTVNNVSIHKYLLASLRVRVRWL